MQFTLDSVAHAKQCLKQNYKDKEITVNEKLCSLEALLENDSNDTFYFGVVTNGTGSEIILQNEHDHDFVTVDKNNQIIVLFHTIKKIGNVYGQFRGYELKLKGFKPTV